MFVKIKVYSDYVCPFCFIGEAPLKEAIKGKDVEVEWMPFELRPQGTEPLSPQSSYIKQAWEQSVKPLSARFGVEMDMPFHLDPVPATHLTHEGFQFAKDHGKADEYVDAAFKAYWQKGLDVGNIDVLTALAEEIGLDSEAFAKSLRDRTYQIIHRDAIKHAYQDAQIQAVPTFIIGDQVFQGLNSKETFEQILKDQVVKKKPFIGDSCSADSC
ncbi:DsbA family oxidoreductase [Bacillus sp. UMB0893]|uniref:DsbA family oxidoreductase n=1 Tax=Bacillus sp. UMB0893 TaxID=2066053 RepID=UPI000C77DE14|nr:DsbA family oxidoreductase [Bacillus sp. UMB0893]PLR69097.1 2-hydroxychromene-2-carboxylate isomerase [Bacillus sp. UMB0893]